MGRIKIFAQGFAIGGRPHIISSMIEVDFFAPRQTQAKALRKLSDRKLAAFEKEISQTPPYSPDSPLRKLVVKERVRRARTPKKRLSVRSLLKSLTKRRRRK